jgi:hypothetical protein
MNYVIKKVILFVQGPEQSFHIWDKLISFIESNSELSQNFICVPYEADTKEEGLIKATDKLSSWYFYQKSLYLNTDVVLVGHGLGGIIIQNFLSLKLESGMSRDFFNLRQVIFFAVPHLGYDKVPTQLKIFNLWSDNSFLSILKKWDTDIFSINEKIKEFIINPEEFNSYYHPTSVQCFGGSDDRIVSSESSKGNWQNFQLLKGNHISILESTDGVDDNFLNFKKCLINPPEHKGIYYIENFQTIIKVEPFEAGFYEAKYGLNTRIVKTDNYGTIFRKVLFSPNNICKKPYILRYAIENDEGFIEGITSGGENITSSKNQQLYEARGLEYYFEFTPEIYKEFSLLVKLYKGFDKGFQDTHFHLGNGNTRFKNLEIIIDLSSYISEKHLLIISPTLMLHPEDTHSCNDRFSERSDDRIILPISVNNGKWAWEISDIGGGVIDLFWDINPK